MKYQTSSVDDFKSWSYFVCCTCNGYWTSHRTKFVPISSRSGSMFHNPSKQTALKLITLWPLLRLAGVMAELIEENEPTPLRKFLLNVQWGIRYIIRATPLLCAQKRKYFYGSRCQDRLIMFCYKKRRLNVLGFSCYEEQFEQNT